VSPCCSIALIWTFITGSNARVFSSELSTRLSERHIEIPIHPLVYPEFLEFSGLLDGDEA
jgi:predicted AAA+ superfamily ATPase